MRILLIDSYIHHKNKKAIQLMAERSSSELVITNDSNRFYEEWDIVFIPVGLIPSYIFPRAKRIVYGPHNFVFPTKEWLEVANIFDSRCVYTCLSGWVQTVYKEFGTLPMLVQPLPFCVDIDKFKPENKTIEYDCFVYFKHRHPSILDSVLKELSIRNMKYIVLSYGKYNENDYINILHKVKFGIWVGCSESQGFAVQECLSCNVPLLVLNATSMFDEYNNDKYDYIKEKGKYKLEATSLTYWNDSCGIIVSNLSNDLDKMRENYMKFSPRQFIVDTLSPEKCLKRFTEDTKKVNDLFLIVSVINTGNNPWSYTKTRSVFSTEDRFNQTLETIESIRNKMPDSKIMIVECSDLTSEQNNQLKSLVDIYLNLYSFAEAQACCLQTDKKGLGESYQTMCAVKYILENKIEFNRLFKLSGRYSLNEEFDEKKYSNSAFTFKDRVIQGAVSHSTVIYSVPFSLVDHHFKSLCMAVNFYLSGKNAGYEEVVPPLLEPKIELTRMGAQGLVAVNGDFFTC